MVKFTDSGRCVECGTNTLNKKRSVREGVEEIEFVCDECIDREFVEIKTTEKPSKQKMREMFLDSIEDFWCV